MKKTIGDIIILHNCTKYYDYRPYCSWDMVHDGCNCYFSFWAIFCPFAPVTSKKMKISKNWNKNLEISPLYTIAPKIMITCCTVPEIWHVTHVIFIFHFGLFFALFSPTTPPPPKKKKIKISKTWKNIMIRWFSVPEIWCTTDKHTDRQKKLLLEVGAPPKKMNSVVFYVYQLVHPLVCLVC